MDISNTTNWVLGILATIFLGALGSGLWSLLLEPFLKKFGRTFISISTFGIKSIRNKMYAEAARGRRDYSTKLLMFIIFIAVSFPAMFVFAWESRTQRREAELKEAISIVSAQNVAKDDFESKVLATLNTIQEDRRSSARIQILILTSIMLVSLFFHYSKIMYTQTLINYYERCLKICMPYFVDNEYNRIVSSFSLIRNKEDYFAVITTLSDIAKRGDLPLPPLGGL